MRRIILYSFVLYCGLSAAPAFAQDAGAGRAVTLVVRPDTSFDEPGIVVDDADAGRVEITAYWKRLSASEIVGAYGSSVLSDGGFAADAVVRFRPILPVKGNYAVYQYWPALPTDGKLPATNASVTVRHSAGVRHFVVNQRAASAQWHLLGVFPFDPAEDGYVEIRNDAADGVVLADAVRFVPAETTAEAPDPAVVTPR